MCPPIACVLASPMKPNCSTIVLQEAYLKDIGDRRAIWRHSAIIALMPPLQTTNLKEMGSKNAMLGGGSRKRAKDPSL